jgi:hypothetical protein
VIDARISPLEKRADNATWFDADAKASVLDLMGSAKSKITASCLWQKYWDRNNSCRQMICAPRWAA